MTKINVSTLQQLLRDTTRFSVQLKKTAQELSTMQPLELQPIIDEILNILSIRSRNILQPILALRLIKETLLLADQTFYLVICLQVLPKLHQHILRTNVKQRGGIVACLCSLWQTKQETISQSQIQTYQNLLLFITEFFMWFESVIKLNPYNIPQMAQFRSHFCIYNKLRKQPAISSFTFFRDDERQTYLKNYQLKYESQQSDLSMNIWKKYCEQTVSTFLQTQQQKYFISLRKIIESGNHHTINAVIKGLQQWILTGSVAGVRQLKIVSQICRICEVQLNQLIQIKLVPHFFKRAFKKNEDEQIKQQILVELSKMKRLYEQKFMNFDVFEKIMQKTNFPISKHKKMSTEYQVSQVLNHINMDKKQQMHKLYGSQRENVIDMITFAQQSDICQKKIIKSSKSIKILDQLKMDDEYNERGIPQIQNAKSTSNNWLHIQSKNQEKNNVYSAVKQQEAMIKQKKNRKQRDIQIPTFSNVPIPQIPQAISQIKSHQSFIDSLSDNSSSMLRKMESIQRRRHKNRLHAAKSAGQKFLPGESINKQSKIMRKTSPNGYVTQKNQIENNIQWAKQQYYQKINKVECKPQKNGKQCKKQGSLVEKAWKRMESKPAKIKNDKNEAQGKIYIEQTIQKPQFGFKYIQNNEDTTGDFFESKQSTQNSQNFEIKASKNNMDTSNFMDVLKFQSDAHIRVVKSGGIQGFFMSKMDNREQKMAKKIVQIKKHNEQYDHLLREKERDIEAIKKKLERQQKQAKNYETNLAKAYENAYDNPDSLLMNSLNYDTSDEKMERRINNKIKIRAQFKSVSKKIFKQILYGKCLLLENQYIQIGFDNKTMGKNAIFYFTIKENIVAFRCQAIGNEKCGFEYLEDFSINVQNIPAGKKIKMKLLLNYMGSFSDEFNLMKLKIQLKLNQNFTLNQQITIPYCLYRNYFTSVPLAAKNDTAKANKEKKNNDVDDYIFVTEWEHCNQDFAINPKQFLSNLFPHGKWVQEGVYHVLISFKEQLKKINILVNQRNFALEMDNDRHYEVVNIIGSLLSKYSNHGV